MHRTRLKLTMRCKYVKMVKYAFLQKKRTSSSAFMIVHTKTISKLQNTCLYSETFIFQDYVRTLREPICCCQKMNCTYLLEKDSDGVTFPQKEIENLLWKLIKVDFDDSCISSKIFWKIATSTHFSNKKCTSTISKKKTFPLI